MSYLSSMKNKLNQTIDNLSHGWDSFVGRTKSALTKFSGKSGSNADENEASTLQQWQHSYGLGLIPVDLYEENDAIFVRVEVPGMGKNDLSIQVVGTELLINGDKKITRKQKKDQFFLMECAYGSFMRVVNLPCLVDDSKAEASCKNGVLKIRLPKKNPSSKKVISIE